MRGCYFDMIVEARVAPCSNGSTRNLRSAMPSTFSGMVRVICRGGRLSVQGQFQLHPHRPRRTDIKL